MKQNIERRLLYGSFAELERAFIRDMSALRGAAPLSPVAVVVPNQLLRMQLARRLALEGGAHANVHFFTIAGLARRLAADALALEGKAPLPELCARLALAKAVRECGELEYFAPVAEKPGFQAALLATCRDLKDSLLDPDALELARRSLPERDILRRKLKDVVRLWRAMEHAKEAGGFYDETELLGRAYRQALADKGGMARLIIYGLYDFNAAQARFIAACCENTPVLAYFPWRDEPAFRYALPAYRWFCGMGFAAEEVGRGAGGPTSQPETLIVSAPGTTPEAEEIAREIAHAEQDPPDATYGILLRSPEPYRSLLKETFDGMGMKGYYHGGLPLRLRPAARALGLLAVLLNGRLRRSEVTEFFISAPLRSRPGDPPGLSVEQWVHFSRLAGVVQGAEEWQRNLERLAERMAIAVLDREEGQTVAPAAAAEQASLAAFRARIGILCDGLRRTAQASSWATMTRSFGELYRELADAGGEAASVDEILDSLAMLDVMGVPPSPELFQRFLAVQLERPARGETTFGEAEPAVSPLMEARGAIFDVVMLPGLVEGAFPLPPRQDPVLLDAERTRIAAALRAKGIEAEIPLKSRRREEEEMLFALAAQSARRRLVLSFPRLDAKDGRARIPSPYLLRVIESFLGQPADYRTLEEFLRTDPRGRLLKIGPAGAVRGRALRPLEYDLAALEETLRSGEAGALLYLGRISPFFMAALRAESARWGQGEFSECDGVIRNPGLLAARAIRRHEEDVVSPTRLECYARCPFEFFMRHVLGLKPLMEPERVASITPLDRGSLMHGILWEFMSGVAERGGSLSAASWPALEATARRRFERFEGTGLTGFPLTWQIERARMLRELRLFLVRHLRDAAGFQPSLFEVRFGLPPGEVEESPSSTTTPATLEIEQGRVVRFGGRIDRVDVDAARGASRVVDYKSGRSPEGRKDNSFAGGGALQLPVYMLAAEMLLPDNEPQTAEYLYLHERSEKAAILFDRSDWPEKLDKLRRIVKTILDGIAQGRFFAIRAEWRCDSCELRDACGHGRRLAHKWNTPQAATRDYLKMSEIE